MERCPYCNSELPAVAHFCPICGRKLEEGAAPDPETGEHSQASRPESGLPADAAATPPPAPAGQEPPPPPPWRVPPVPGSLLLGPAFMAGIAAGVLVGVPVIGDYCCLWTLGCGVLSVFFFHKQFGRHALPNEAARLGLLSGFFGFLTAFVVAFVSHALIQRDLFGMVEFLRGEFRQRAEMMKPPNADRVLEIVNSPNGGPFLLLAWATTYLFGFLAFGILGALVAGAIGRRRQ